jgi:hypothetical protein
MEEKVYSRSVNKINLAAIVIDQKDPKRNFTKKELSDILTLDNWVRFTFSIIGKPLITSCILPVFTGSM